MRTFKLFLITAAAALACGCAAFTSGDIRVDRETANAMLEDRTVTPFADIQLTWKLYPYRAPSEDIGQGYIAPDTGQFKSPEIKPVAADSDDQARLLKRARSVFAEAGLYDKTKGRGTLRLQLDTLNKWTYGDLLRSYLVETAFIFILPSSIRTNYLLTADFQTSTGTAKVEVLGRNKTVFHLVMLPLYPLFTPSTGENSLLRQMLWRSATDTYEALKRAEQAAKAKAAAKAEQAPPPQPAPETPKPPEPAPAAQPEQPVTAPGQQPAPAVTVPEPQPAAPAAPARTLPPSEETPDD